MAFKRTMTYEEAFEKLETLCDAAERCESELREKLYRWGINSRDTERLLDDLHARHLYDDQRFANAYVHDKLQFSRWGRRKIVVGLIQKRIDESIRREALDTIYDSEYAEIAHALLKSKARQIKEGNTYEGRTKLYRFGLMRGFESDVVAAAIRGGNLFEHD